MAGADRDWVRVLDLDELPEGRVQSVTCRHRTVCMTHHEGTLAALDNRCPHQGGPLGEGSIEGGWLRCPWHGWDFHPTTGASPDGHSDGVEAFPVEIRDDGVYVGLPASAPAARTVSDAMADTLAGWGVRWVFGMVGHSNLGLADALRRQTEAGRMGYVAIRHEGAAAFACSAYGKLTGRPAAALTIAGPGATNLLTGLWDAHMDRAPVLALTGQVDTQVIGRSAFQELDLEAAFGQVAQFSAVVQRDSDHVELAVRAVRSAILNDGVSHLIFPDQVQRLPVGDDVEAGLPDGRIVARTPLPAPDQLEAAIERICSAERPCIIVGHGARAAMPAVLALAEALLCPVLTTFKGKGLISDHHALGCGVLGRSGTPIASWFMNEADLLVVLGASFSDHTGISPKKPIVQIDRDPLALGQRLAVSAPVHGAIGPTVQRIRAAIEARGAASEDHTEEIAARWQIWRAEKAARLAEERGQGIASVAVFESLARVLPEDAILCVDVGNNTYSFGRYFEVKHQAVLMSGYLGSIGFALPAALGAWAATKEKETPWHGRRVISISGDGGLAQYLSELTTLVAHGMNVVHVVLNNGALGKISKEQRAAGLDVWQTELCNPSFAEVATSCGALGLVVEQAADLDGALQGALEHDGPALVEILTDVGLV